MAFITSVSNALTSGLTNICRPTATNGALTTSRSPFPTTPLRRSTRTATTPCMMASPQRKFLVGGNWKCNMNKASIRDLVTAFNAGTPLDDTSIEVVVAPPSVYLESTRDALRADFATCIQNAWVSAGGAFTGEIDAVMAKDVGAAWVLLGHSERRHLPQIKETDAVIAQKAQYALTEGGMSIIYCIGELLEEREAGDTLKVCQRQLQALADAIGDWSKVVIAYEPVWAIGTGKVATPDQAEEVHAAVRQWLGNNVSKEVAGSTRILYGGSVSPANCHELAKKDNVDGFLVGGASLKPTFLEIVDSYKATLAGAV